MKEISSVLQKHGLEVNEGIMGNYEVVYDGKVVLYFRENDKGTYSTIGTIFFNLFGCRTTNSSADEIIKMAKSAVGGDEK